MAMTLEEAATHNALYKEGSMYEDKAIKHFKAGAEWQKEQDKELIEALKNIAAWPGNLPDERYISRTGANDAALRGGMVVAMRQIALSALKKI